jgi:hypothetical protein
VLFRSQSALEQVVARSKALDMDEVRAKIAGQDAASSQPAA